MAYAVPSRSWIWSFPGHNVERGVDVAETQEGVGEQRVDEWGVALGDERSLPRANRLTIVAARRVRRPEVERSGEELGVELERLPELLHRQLEVTL
jgi:hypothetical protein